MKLCSISLKNFYGYKEEITILFDNFTALIGKNDIGKSSVLEVLDIFSKPVHPIEKSDLNVNNLLYVNVEWNHIIYTSSLRELVI